jgi:hypothetical protein
MSNNMIAKPEGGIALSPEQLNAHRAKQQVENMIREIMWLRSMFARLAASSPGGALRIECVEPEPVGNVNIEVDDTGVTFTFHRQVKETSPLLGPGGKPIIHVKEVVEQCPECTSCSATPGSCGCADCPDKHPGM